MNSPEGFELIGGALIFAAILVWAAWQFASGTWRLACRFARRITRSRVDEVFAITERIERIIAARERR